MSLLNFINPNYCIYCKKESENVICKDCWSQFEKHKLSENRCKKCYHFILQDTCHFCSSRFIYFDSLIAFYEYNSFTRKALLEWKYKGVHSVYKFFLHDLIKTIQRIQPDRIGFIRSGKHGTHYRSFEVLETLVKEASKNTQIPFSSDLVKVKKIKQSKNKQLERFFDVLFSFRLTKEIKGINKYLLVEDLVTTGATSNEASRVLKENKVREVYIVSIFMEEMQEDSIWNQYQNQKRMIL